MYHIKQFFRGLGRVFVLLILAFLTCYTFIMTPLLWWMWFTGGLVKEPITMIIMLPGTAVLIVVGAWLIYNAGE